MLKRLYGDAFPGGMIERMVLLNKRVRDCGVIDGGPFEFNLRDLMRFADATKKVKLNGGKNLLLFLV